MSGKILDGKPIAVKINEELKAEIQRIKARSGKIPHLASMQVGDSPSSAVYIKSQAAAALGLGMDYKSHNLPIGSAQKDIEDFVKKLNKDVNVTGVILQLPFPKGIDAKRLQGAIAIDKDVEAVNPENLGRVFTGAYRIAPCTAMAIMEIIGSTGVDLAGKEAVVVGRSAIVGKSAAMLLLEKNATVTICHTGTAKREKLAGHIKKAEVLVVAAGKPGLVKGRWIRKGAVVIDVGATFVGNKIVGDVEFEAAAKRAAYITPVPGGLGPLTVAVLMRNTVELFRLQTKN